MSIGAIMISVIFLIIGWMISARLKSKFREYSQVHLSKDLTGGEIARLMLADNGIHDVKVVSVDGQLTDHYNPETKTVNLSHDVFSGRNAAAAAIAAHECGHAVQHANAYSMLTLRSALVPIQSASATIMNYIMMALIFGGIFAGGILSWNTALLVMIVCYSVFALFAIVTLPVEFDASKRALAWVKTRNIVTTQEYDMAQDALKWAAMTYVVAAIGAITTLAYYVMLYMGGRSRD
jgi:uncharacterized protein